MSSSTKSTNSTEDKILIVVDEALKEVEPIVDAIVPPKFEPIVKEAFLGAENIIETIEKGVKNPVQRPKTPQKK